MSKIFVLDTLKQLLKPCSSRRAKMLLRRGKAAVFRRFPFTIILKRRVEDLQSEPLRLKLDPGSKKTGLAIIDEQSGEVVFAGEINHRGEQIKTSLESRRAARRGRRNRHTRYRKPRFNNRLRKPGWLPPSLESRICNIMTWVGRLRRLTPIGAISQELVKFDTQLMQDPEITGVEYQQGELSGYEVREYLLEKFGRKCAYCKAENLRLEIDHIIPKSRGGSNRVSNLTIACRACNCKKGARTAEEFGYREVQKQAKEPLKDAAAVNSTRRELYRRLQATGLALETGAGSRTKFNRVRQGLRKTHWIDAACVGASTPQKLNMAGVNPLTIKAAGHGRRQRCRSNKYGFPIGHAPKAKFFLGFQTGDIVRAVIANGKYAGTHTGRIAVRFRPSFRLKGFDVNPKHLTIIHRSDGYEINSLRMEAALPLQLTAMAV